MIQIEKTPNPNSLKFLTERTVSSIGSEEFQSKNLDKIDNIFIKELLSLNGVELILLAKNFLTVKKNDKVSWDALKPSVISYLNDYFNKNQQPILQEIKKKGSVSDENEIIIKIKEVLDTKSGQQLQEMVVI